MAMLDRETYKREREICDRAEALVRAAMGNRGGAVPESVTSHPDYMACDNDMRGRVAQFEILTDLPDRFVAYVGKQRPGSGVHDLTTWTGDILGSVLLGAGWPVRSWIGSRMFQAHAYVGGLVYTGRTFGEGMVLPLRLTAASKRQKVLPPEQRLLTWVR